MRVPGDEVLDAEDTITLVEGARILSGEIRSVTGNMCSLAQSFRDTGNEKVAERIEYLSERLIRVEALMQTAVSNQIDTMLHDQVQSTNTVMEAVFAGLAIGAGEKPERLFGTR